MAKVLIIGGHGLGDCLLSLQCASKVHPWADVLISSRQEIYNVIVSLFKHKFNVSRLNEAFSENNALLKNPDMWAAVTSGYEEAYYAIPDLLFNNKYAFDFKKFHTNPRAIVTTRLLEDNRPKTKTIYVGLMTTTPGYWYEGFTSLIVRLAVAFPNYCIHVPIVSKWAGKDIKVELPKQGPGNLKIVEDEDFTVSMNTLGSSSYFIGTDNGPSHIAYHFGIPRLVLDPQWQRLPWIARWREDYTESVPMMTSVGDIIDIVKANLTIPASNLIPKAVCPFVANYTQDLLIKDE